MMRRHPQGGFILPLSILLVVFLSISGMSFLQLDFLERKLTLNNVDNHGAFYVANAGIERARDVLKIPISGSTISWTSVLQSPVWNGGALAAGVYRTQSPPDLLLCPFGVARGCVVLPPGSPVGSPDNLVFGGTFDDGQYAVRAYNNESNTTDNDQILTVRALGLIRGDQKLLEANIQAVSALNLINCDDDGFGCPEINGCPNGICMDPAPGREPASSDNLPKLDFPLTNSQNYYRQSSNFIGSGKLLGSGGTVRTSIPGSGAVQSNSYYNLTGNVTVKNTTASNVVIFTTGTVTVETGTNLTNIIVVGTTGVDLKGGGTLIAPLPYPAVISGKNITGGSGTKTVFGTIFAPRPVDAGGITGGGTINVNPITLHGVVIGNRVQIQGTSTFYTDDHSTDPNYTKYYAFMPGFVYPPEMKTTVAVPGTWREIQ